MTQIDTNKYAHDTPLAARRYANSRQLWPAESRIFDLLADELPRSRLLDIGVGAGRTTAHLLPRVANYIGIDYSRSLIDRARKRFPNADLRLQDARNLDDFASDSLDVVLFSYNGLDYISHEERLSVIGQIFRILRPGGYFIFSSHNRAYPIRAAHDPRHLQSAFNPLKTASSIATYLMGLRNSVRLRPLERHERDYSIINDQALSYGLLTYYIHASDQRDQLASFGFTNTRGFGMAGENIDLAERHPELFMIYYLTSKPADP